MQKNSVLLLTLVLAVIGAALYYLAAAFYFYWTYWWFDVLMHFLVSLTGGLGIFWGLFDSGIIFRKRFNSKKASILMVLLCVLVVGIGWEIFEYVNDFTDSTEGYVLDTINDIILDSAGAIVATLIATRKRLDIFHG